MLTLSVGLIAQSADSVPVVQPGAPGQASKTLSPTALRTSSRPLSDADVSFMQGMIMHHSQAVEMTDLLKTRTKNKASESMIISRRKK